MVQCASGAVFSEPDFKTSVIQSTYQCPSSALKITVLTSISVAASDSESHTISANWKSSDLHIDFASEVSTISLILNLEQGPCSSSF